MAVYKPRFPAPLSEKNMELIVEHLMMNIHQYVDVTESHFWSLEPYDFSRS